MKMGPNLAHALDAAMAFLFQRSDECRVGDIFRSASGSVHHAI